MKRKTSIFTMIVVLLVFSPLAHAQPRKKIPRIGLLSPTKSIAYLDDAFLQGLQELGYVEGKNIIIEKRDGKGKNDVSNIMAEFVRLKVDVIVVHGNRAVFAARKATSIIPIVSAYAGDLVSNGLISSVTKPGGNITGSYNVPANLAGKRVEILLESIPGASRIAVLGHPEYPKNKYLASVKAARRMGLKVQEVKVSESGHLSRAYAAMTGQKSGGVVIIRGPFTNKNQKRLLALAARNRLPTICEDSGWVSRGCLLSYGPSNISMHRRAAFFVDRILKGAKPGDLPMERPRKFEFAINLKTAKKIGLTVPPELLLRATKVIR